MKGRSLCYILMAFLSWVSVTSRPFASHHDASSPHQDHKIPHFPKDNFGSSEVMEESSGRRSYGNEEEYRGLSRLGSRPPNCAHKCEGCYPCDPIQTPTTTDRIGVQNANYEPEGWKCKCGNSFFNP